MKNKSKKDIPIHKTFLAFTLAEVLVTLVVIGILAALTLPALITNIQDSQFKEQWRKTYSDLSQATARIMADNGGTLEGVFTGHSIIKNKYIEYMSYIKSCNIGETEGCWHSKTGTIFDNAKFLNGGNIVTANWGDNQPGFILSNGAMVRVAWLDTNCTSYCGWAAIDMNGFTGPNRVGKDIHHITFRKKGIKPWGTPGDGIGSSCSTSSTGESCAAQYLRQ